MRHYRWGSRAHVANFSTRPICVLHPMCFTLYIIWTLKRRVKTHKKRSSGHDLNTGTWNKSKQTLCKIWAQQRSSYASWRLGEAYNKDMGPTSASKHGMSQFVLIHLLFNPLTTELLFSRGMWKSTFLSPAQSVQTVPYKREGRCNLRECKAATFTWYK